MLFILKVCWKMPNSDPLVNVSTVEILISAAPLVLIAFTSNLLRLDIESPIVVSTIRAFVQLSLLAFILDPIFTRGVELWWLVVGYCFFMILLASYEGSTRSKYYVDGQFWMVFWPMFVNVVAVALFAFFAVIRPQPRWGRLIAFAISCHKVTPGSLIDLCTLFVNVNGNDEISILPLSMFSFVYDLQIRSMSYQL